MPAEASVPFESPAPERHMSAWLLPAAAGCILLAIVLVAPQFLKPANIVNLLRQVALNGIIACGMTVVMVAGGFDLSVGGVAAVAGVLAIRIAPANLGLAIALPILAGAIAGA